MNFKSENIWNGLLVFGLLLSFPAYICFNNLITFISLRANGINDFNFEENGFICSYILTRQGAVVAILFIILRWLVIFLTYTLLKSNRWGSLFSLGAITFLFFDILFFCLGWVHKEIHYAFLSLSEMQILSHYLFKSIYILAGLSIIPWHTCSTKP